MAKYFVLTRHPSTDPAHTPTSPLGKEETAKAAKQLGPHRARVAPLVSRHHTAVVLTCAFPPIFIILMGKNFSLIGPSSPFACIISYVFLFRFSSSPRRVVLL
ncbi:hypothetical protein V8C37DRAFT_47251 [Trichoderma ceciliae]